MDLLQRLIETGRIVDIMVLFVLVEVAVLLAYRFRTGRGIAPLSLLLNVGAGGSLMLALGATLKNMGFAMIGFFLVLSLVFHIADLVKRWPR
ncbi:MAG: hypothetical protein AB8G18_18145 [Gammaproteobacteria bacterium]